MENSAFSQQVVQIAGLGVWQVVTGRPMTKPLEPTNDPRWNKKSGVFVTLKQGMHIRGSVGLLESSTTLQETLFDAGQSAATHDHRFQPVSESEIESVGIEVVIIDDVQKITESSAITIGKSGLIISRGDKRGVLLPQVAFERGWTAEQFLEAACEKAGLQHNDWKDPNTLVESFTCHFFEAPSIFKSIEEFVITYN